MRIFYAHRNQDWDFLQNPPNNDQIEERWQENDGFANPLTWSWWDMPIRREAGGFIKHISPENIATTSQAPGFQDN